MSPRRRQLGMSAFVMVVVSVRLAAADKEDPEAAAAARAISHDAREAFDRGEWVKAADLYHRAGELVSAPTLLVREARALVKMGKLVAASELYVKASRFDVEERSPRPFVAAIGEAKAELAALKPRIPTLKIVVEGETADVQVKLDGAPLPPVLINVDRPIDPGPHLIEGRLAGRNILPERVRLAESEHLEILLHGQEEGAVAAPTPAPNAASPGGDVTRSSRPPTDVAAPRSGSTQRTLGWVALGAGGVGLGVGLVAGLVANGKKSALNDACNGNACPPSAQSDLDGFRSFRTVSTVGYIAGAVCAVGGGVLLLTAPSASADKARARVSPWIGVASAGVEGAF